MEEAVGGAGCFAAEAVVRRFTQTGDAQQADTDVKIPQSVTQSISYKLRGLSEFSYLYKRT